MAYQCPHCHEEIERLDYSEDATTYGSYDIETEDYESEETEGAGNTRFKCPECEEEIDSINDLINTEQRDRNRTIEQLRQHAVFDPPIFEEAEEIERERELPVPPAIEQNWRGEYSGYHNSHDRQRSSAILICPNCGSKNEAIENETVECYKCNKEINIINAKETIQVEKPNNPSF